MSDLRGGALRRLLGLPGVRRLPDRGADGGGGDPDAVAAGALDPEGRNQRHTYVQPKPGDPRFLVVQQMLVDTAELNDWALELEVDLVASREARQAVFQVVRCGEFR